MVVTTMESTSWLIQKLQTASRAIPELEGLEFQPSSDFSWQFKTKTIHFNPADPMLIPLLLHEYSHALLGHDKYTRDIELLKIEREAWDQATTISATYGVSIDADFVEDTLDTYRDWMHSRSLCPTCSSTGLQTGPGEYNCLACHHTWRVNQAKTCALRRHLTK